MGLPANGEGATLCHVHVLRCAMCEREGNRGIRYDSRALYAQFRLRVGVFTVCSCRLLFRALVFIARAYAPESYEFHEAPGVSTLGVWVIRWSAAPFGRTYVHLGVLVGLAIKNNKMLGARALEGMIQYMYRVSLPVVLIRCTTLFSRYPRLSHCLYLPLHFPVAPNSPRFTKI